ncbi:MAG TPA: serine hydrolase domain-containing protein [Nitrospirota bacterium]|nr:serine hydrolase domain-containing protein [Nitrospirota bacterium]
MQINYDSVKTTVSQFIWKEMKKNDVTGLSIALVDGQRVVWAQGFGYANERKDIVATPETVYRIGSLTKIFTALATMQLAEQEKLSIDEPLKTYLPEFSIRTRFNVEVPITLRELMTHHSGLPSDLQKGMWSKKPDSFTTVVNLINDEYMAYPPGYIFSYSNIGYDLLGHVLERVSRQDYSLYIQSALLHPLGMQHTGFTPPAETWLLSAGYYKGTEMDDPPLRDIPAGGMYSNVLDMSKFMAMLFNNGNLNGRQIIKPATLAEMFKPQNSHVPLDLGLRIGLGWMLGGLGEVDILNAGSVVHHAGATLMFRSEIIILPRHRLGAVVLANSSSSGRVVSKVAVQALITALEAKTGIKQPLADKPEEADIILSPEVKQNYTGDYASIVGLAEITPSPDRFMVEALNRTFQLVPHANGKFGVKYVLLGLFPFSLAELDNYEVSYSKVAGHEILRASTRSSDLLIAEKIQSTPVPTAWQMRIGRYKIENLGDDFPLINKFAIRYDSGFLFAECSMPFFFKSTLRFPLKTISDTEVILAGLGGRSMGETIRAGKINGKEKLFYSGYVLVHEE